MKLATRALVPALVTLALLGRGVAAADDAPPKPLEAKANVGYVQTGGNTDVLTLLASDKVVWRQPSWTYTQEAGAVYGEDHGQENSGRYLASLRADRNLTPRASLYALADWKRNFFGGVNRQFDEGLGVAYHAILPKPHLLDFEAGVGLLQRRTTLPTDERFATARFATHYEYFFTEKATAEAALEYVMNLDDTENSDLNGRAALVAPLAGGLSLNFGYNAQYRGKPLPGLEHLDWTVSAGLQFSY